MNSTQPKPHRYAGKIELYQRGWTDALIREHLPSPEARGVDLSRPPRPLGAPGNNPFWKLTTIRKVEPTIADKLASNIPNGYTHVGTSTLKNRGWTEALIREHLPPPEARGAQLFMRPRPFISGTRPFWKWETIRKVESTIADKLHPNTLHTRLARLRARRVE